MLALVATACSGSAAEDDVAVEVVATGLLNPVGLAVLPDGRVLVAEEGTGESDDSAGVSLVEDGGGRRVISGLPSGRDSGDLSGVPLVAVGGDDTVYTAHFGSGRLLTLPIGRLATESGPEDLGETMVPLNQVTLTNPFDLTFDAAGEPVVSDASQNGVATRNPDGTVRFIHRFGDLEQEDGPAIDAVPTGIARLGEEYLVTLTGGCPYPPDSGLLVAVDGERGERVVADGLDMPIDVAVDGNGTIWVLEFAEFEEGASCFTGEGYQAGTGRLSRLVDDELETVYDGLDFPGSLAIGDGVAYVTEVFGGRVLRLTPPPGEAPVAAPPPAGPAEADAWRFASVAPDVGLDFRHGAFRTEVGDDPVAMMGAGLCWIDYDDDGWLDLYLVNSHALAEAPDWDAGGGLPTNALYRNEEGRFSDVSEGSGADLAMRGNGCVAADFDGDGHTDLYVTADGPNALLRNEGGGRFSEVAAAAGVDAPEWNSAASAGDVDGDGDLDLFVGAYLDLTKTIPKPSGAFPQDFVGIPDRLYRNDGDGTFTEITADAGLAQEDRTLGALFSDLDDDGDLDLYLAVDGQPNRLYENVSDGEPRFVDATDGADVGDSGSGMGIAGGDYDGDGSLDLLVTNWDRELHALYRNSGELGFEYRTFRIGFSGLGNGDTGWGASWGDFDQDGDQDLIVANGQVPITDLDADRQDVRLYHNRTREGFPAQFREIGEEAGLAAAGPFLARGTAVADYDNDGDLDAALGQIGGPAVLLRNEEPPGNWLVIDPDPWMPGIAVEVTLDDGSRLVRETRAGGSYLASEDPRIHVGLGDAAPDSVIVRWPDGSVRTLDEVEPGRLLVVAKQ